MNIGRGLRQLREKYGLSKIDMSIIMNCNQATIQNIESGVTFPRESYLKKVSQLFFVTESYLLFLGVDDKDVIDEGYIRYCDLKSRMNSFLDKKNKSLVIDQLLSQGDQIEFEFDGNDMFGHVVSVLNGYCVIKIMQGYKGKYFPKENNNGRKKAFLINDLKSIKIINE